jgi:hypothetical protein
MKKILQELQSHEHESSAALNSKYLIVPLAAGTPA